MDFETTIYTNKARNVRARVKDQGGNDFLELPPGATIDYSSSNPAVCNPSPNAGGMSARLPSGEVGEAEITVTPGGSLTGDTFAPRVGKVTVVHSDPSSFNLEISDEEDETPPPPPPES